MNISLTEEEYLALVSLARKGTTPEGSRGLEVFLKDVDRKNDITRYTLLVQWQELDSPLPPNTRFPAVWPPEMRAFIEQTTRPVSRQDVEKLVADRATSATNIMVTRDVAGLAGWQKLDFAFPT